MRKLFTLALLSLISFSFGLNAWGQATVFSENIGTPTGTTTIANYSTGTAPATFQNKGTLTYNNGGAAVSADIRITSISSGYTGASGNGNVFFTTTSGSYGFSIESINVSNYTNLSLQFGYRKESASAHATFSFDYWDGAAWVTVANTSAALFNEAANASVGWYLSKAIALPAAAQINGLKIRWVKSGTLSIRIDDIVLSGQVASPATTSISPTAVNAGSPGITLTVNGSNFVNGSTVTWNGSGRTTTFINANQLTAAIPASDLTTAGSAAIGVTNPGPFTSNTQTFTINPNSGPIFSLTSSLADFGNVCINTTAGPNSFTLDGNSLDGSNSSTVTIDALPGFSYSLTSGGTYTNTLSFTYTGNSFTGQTIYAKFNPTAVQSYNGDILITGGGISNYPVPAKGAGVNSLPSVTTGGNTPLGSSATLNASITAAGCNAVTAYGFEYSTTSGFADGTGTPLASGNLSGGNFSAQLTGLVANRRYYYKAVVTTSGGTVYGTQQAFNAPPIPVIMSAQPSFTFTETFADIANWQNFFAGGVGSEHFSQAPFGAGIVPNPAIVVTNTVFSTGSSGGVQRGTDQIAPLTPTQSIVLLSTGATDNTSSSAFDFYMDFTGVNAGTLSFDYQSLNNSTGDRNASLRVYATTDGTTFTEVTNVLNFTNNAPISGSKTNIALPAFFNNIATARLRFYFYNGTGGTTGSRPKLSIDNIIVTAVATTPCSSPTAPATSLVFGTVTDVSVAGSFTASSPAADNYLIVASTSNSLTSNPVNGQIYNVGDNVGDGTVVAKGSSTSFTATGLSASTTYYFFIFPMNAVCTGGPLYYTTTVLTDQATTLAGLPPCTAPSSQPTNLIIGTATTNSVQGSFTATTADEYLIVRSTSSTLSVNPVSGQGYVAGDVLGNGVVVQRSNTTAFIANGLTPNTTFYFFVFSLNSLNCVNGPTYNTTSPLTGSGATQPLPPCTTPSLQPSNLMLNAANTAIAGNFAPAAGVDAYLIVRSTSSTLSATPADNTDYALGDNLGGGIVIGNSSNNSFMSTGLTPGATYYYFIFSMSKNCSGGTKYLTTSPLTGNKATLNTTSYSYYFGTLHSHSDYSDGNQDNPGYTPTDDYNYAMTAQCMDFLGISEHNHFSSPDNPGNKISTYHSGITQANNFTTAHPSFLALYGMEWGVISGGGHVVVYGNGMDNLFGWESGSGDWGPTNNYDVYVAKNDYTGANGLFKIINNYAAQNTFGSLAHPNLTDYGNLANIAYNAAADSAITATAVESGPASSSNTTYSNPAFSMGYLWYYQTLLAKGYHLGPVVDHDNHKTTFGKATYSRTAIVSPSLSKADIIAAMRNMNFYATQDCDTKVDFMINARMMGTVFTDRYAPVISVRLTDATTNTASAVIRLFYGTPGSGIMPVQVDSVIGSVYNFTDNTLVNGATGYYYIDITNGTSRVVTAPIWYTRNDNSGIILPVKLMSFTAFKAVNKVQVEWSTTQEINTKEFDVERSFDGVKFENISTVTARGNTSNSSYYQLTDARPNSGNNFYRLKVIDYNGYAEYSSVIKINFSKAFTISLSPNPVKNKLTITLANNREPLLMQIMDMNGKIVGSTILYNQTTTFPVTGLSKGLYLVKLKGLSETYTEKMIVE
jgi:hypothetical protein